MPGKILSFPYLTFFFLGICFLSLSCSAEEPWGKDATLVKVQSAPLDKEKPKRGIAQSLIRFHQLVISPADGPRSHFYPSSSTYALQAINKYGFFKGYILGCDRLMRENEQEWVYPLIQVGEAQLKYDPVP